MTTPDLEPITLHAETTTPLLHVADLLQAGFAGGFLEWNEITQLAVPSASYSLARSLPQELLTYPEYITHCFIPYDYAIRGKHKHTQEEYHFGLDRLRWALRQLIEDRFDDYILFRNHGTFSQELADWFIQYLAFWNYTYDPKTGIELEDQSP